MKKYFISIICAIALMFSGTVNFTYAKEKQLIPIAMATDNNYVLPTIVAITSMLESAHDETFYECNLMLSDKVHDENIRKILSLKNKYPNKCEFNFIHMGDAYKGDKTFRAFPTPVYYRLSLPSLLKKHNKCIYLDGDIVVNQDLSSLYSINLDNYYLAGVHSPSTRVHWGNAHARRLGIPDVNQYINSGILLMNLQKMRDESLEDNFNYFIKTKVNKNKRLYCTDQDTINACCYNKIKLLPFKYNMLNYYPVFNDNAYDNRSYLRFYSRQDWDEGRKNPVIIHYALRKPWMNNHIAYANLWWNYAKKTDFYKEIQEWSNLLKNSPDSVRSKHFVLKKA